MKLVRLVSVFHGLPVRVLPPVTSVVAAEPNVYATTAPPPSYIVGLLNKHKVTTAKKAPLLL